MPFVEVKNNIKLYYEEIGHDRLTLVFIHGWTANSWVWENQKEYFSLKNKVILFDLKGHGKSDKPPGKYTIPEYADEIHEAIIKLIGKNEKIVLIGHSMGGMITGYYATHPDYSKNLKGIILCSTTARKLSGAINIIELIKKGLASLDDPEMIETIAKTGYYGKFIRTHKEIFQKNIEEAKKCPKEIALASLEDFGIKFDISDKLSNISVPVLILAGDKDVQVGNNEAQFIHERIPNSKLEILGPKIGHMIQVENPELTNEFIEQFINNL